MINFFVPNKLALEIVVGIYMGILYMCVFFIARPDSAWERTITHSVALKLT